MIIVAGRQSARLESRSTWKRTSTSADILPFAIEVVKDSWRQGQTMEESKQPGATISALISQSFSIL